MKISIESLSPVEKRINFEIPSERVGEEVEKVYRTFQQNARIKGFRAGKVPRPLLERHFGEQVATEVSTHLVEESYAKAVEEHALPVVTRPQVVAEKLIPGQPFRYSATVEVRPEVVVTKYEGVEIEKQATTVKEEEVDAALARLAESFAQVHPVMDRNRVEQGDVVTLDYASSCDGRPIPGLQGKGRLVEIGKETLLPGFQEHLLGVHKGETVQFSLPLSESSDAQSETERLAHVRVTIHDLARKEVPPLDDEFAKDHGECDTLEELREKVRRNLQQAADRRAENEMENTLITRLLTENSFEVPPSLVREQTQRILIEAGVVRPGGDAVASEAALPESVREELTARARHQVQTAFLLDALAKQLGLSVSDEEVQHHIADLASTVGVDRQPQLEAFYARPENRHALQNRLLHERVLRTVVDKATIKTIQKDVAGGEEKD